ncbi:MAG: IPT/TIG domain-containing protein [Candidatus Manganitrophus sp.]|nr:MAG: IPT/TIG domain-containing protein [Candidatus Manganitrophus sp.]
MRETKKRTFRDHFSFFLGLLLFLSWTGPIAFAQMIGSVSPTAGSSGTSVTITGSGFGKRQGASTVTFNGTPAAVTSWIDSEVSVTVPEGATSGPVVVTVDGESTEAEDHFRVIVPVSPPSLSALSPAASPRHSNAVGMEVTLTGSGFGYDQGSNAVTFNGAPAAVIAWSETRIRVKLPEGATTGPVVVTAHDEPSNSLAFTVFPHISSFSPAAGPAGSALPFTEVISAELRGPAPSNLMAFRRRSSAGRRVKSSQRFRMVRPPVRWSSPSTGCRAMPISSSPSVLF